MNTKNKFQEPELENTITQMPLTKKVSERKINEVLSRGLNSSRKEPELQNDKEKNFSLSIMESQLQVIGQLCDKRPKKPGRRIGLSKQDWIMEAVQEKLERETKKYLK